MAQKNQLTNNLNKSSAPGESPPLPKTTLGTNSDIRREIVATRALVSEVRREVVEMRLDSKSRGDNDGKHRAVSNKVHSVIRQIVTAA